MKKQKIMNKLNKLCKKKEKDINNGLRASPKKFLDMLSVLQSIKLLGFLVNATRFNKFFFDLLRSLIEQLTASAHVK